MCRHAPTAAAAQTVGDAVNSGQSAERVQAPRQHAQKSQPPAAAAAAATTTTTTQPAITVAVCVELRCWRTHWGGWRARTLTILASHAALRATRAPPSRASIALSSAACTGSATSTTASGGAARIAAAVDAACKDPKLVTPLDYKHQSAPGQHGHRDEHSNTAYPDGPCMGEACMTAVGRSEMREKRAQEKREAFDGPLPRRRRRPQSLHRQTRLRTLPSRRPSTPCVCPRVTCPIGGTVQQPPSIGWSQTGVRQMAHGDGCGHSWSWWLRPKSCQGSCTP